MLLEKEGKAMKGIERLLEVMLFIYISHLILATELSTSSDWFCTRVHSTSKPSNPQGRLRGIQFQNLTIFKIFFLIFLFYNKFKHAENLGYLQ